MKWPNHHRSHPLKVDIHSHLIPQIDDGSRSISDSLRMIEEVKNLGFQKLITTPHIHPNYRNTNKSILDGLSKVKDEISAKGIDIEIEAGAEYFVDEYFLELLKSNQPLMSFGEKYVLIECSFIFKPIFFETALFEMRAEGYQPILAHPERYKFLEGDISWLRELKESGILFQVTLGSLSGYYGKLPQKLGMKLLKENMIDFLASDLHRITQIDHMKRGIELKEVQKLIKDEKLINHQLL